MSNAIIGALRVVLGADTAQLETGLKSVSASFSKFSSDMKAVGSVAAVAFAAMAGTIVVAVKGAIDQADKLSKSSQKIGIPVEQLSALKYAADLSDVSVESLEKSVGKLSKAMTEAAAKPMSEAANAFRALGVSVTDSNGKLRPTQDVLLSIADKFAGLNDGAGKTAVAMAIFGRAGADMIPLLNSGKTGIQEMMEEAKKFGIVIDADTGKSAEAFNDNLKRLHVASEGIVVQIVGRMLPGLESVSNMMVDAAKNTSLMEGAAKVASVTLQGFATAVYAIGASLKILYTEFSTFIKAVAAAVVGDFSGAWKIVQDGLSSSLVTMQSASQSITNIWTGAANGAKGAADATDKATQSKKDFNYSAMAGKNALDQFVDSQKKSRAAQEAELATMGLAAGLRERLKVLLQGEAIARANQIPLIGARKVALDAEAAAAANLALRLQGAQLVQQNLAPHEAFRLELENNRIAMEAFGASTDAIGRMQQATAEKYGNTWGQVGQSVAGSFQQIGQAFAKESRSMAIVAKAAGIVQATISMFTGAAKALELPFPANLGAWATVLATGAGAVASIKGINAGGFATGGMIRAPGGMGGGDRVRAMVDLEPGEQLDVWRPDQGGGDPRRGGGVEPATVFVKLPELGREYIGAMIEKINAAVKDGYRLQVQS